MDQTLDLNKVDIRPQTLGMLDLKEGCRREILDHRLQRRLDCNQDFEKIDIRHCTLGTVEQSLDLEKEVYNRPRTLEKAELDLGERLFDWISICGMFLGQSYNIGYLC